MTGLEGMAAGAAAKAATSAVGAASDLAADKRATAKAEQQALVEAATKTPGFRQAAEIRGKKLALREQWGLALMRPLAGILGASREYFETDFSHDFAAKIADVPEANMQTPKASIAGPVWEGLSYSLEEPELKDMYLELLAKASDDRVSALAHPSFVETVRQLTSEEARYLPKYLTTAQQFTAIVQYRAQFEPNGGFQILSSHVLNVVDEKGPVVDPMLATYVDNWIRLKLVEVSYDRNLTDDKSYSWELGRPEREAAMSTMLQRQTPDFMRSLQDQGYSHLNLEAKQGVMIATDLGHQFAIAAGLQSSTDN